MNILQSSAVDLVGFEDIDLIKGALPAHGYYTHLYVNKTKGKTMPVSKTRKDGVVQIYWVNPNPEKQTKRVISVNSDEGHDTETHLQHLKDEYGLSDKDIVHLGIGDTVKIVGGKEKSLHGSHALVYGHKWSEKNPAATVVVKTFKPGDKNPMNLQTKQVNVNDIELMAKATPESKELALTTKAIPKKNEPKPIVPKDKAAAAKVDITYGFYTRTSDGQRFFVEDTTGEKIKIKVLFPGKGESDHMELGRDAMKKMLLSGQLVRDVPSPVASEKEKPYSYQVESGVLQDQGLVYYGEGGQPEAKPEAYDVFTKAVTENWDAVKGAVVLTVSKYKDINSYDVEDIASNVFISLVNSVKGYEPYLMNSEEFGLKQFLINKAQESAYAQAYGIYSEKQMNKPLDMTIPAENDTPSAMDAPHAFLDIESIEAMDNLLEKEFQALSDLFPKMPEAVEVLSGWLGIGKMESEYSIEEAADKMDGKIFDNNRKISGDEMLSFLRMAKDRVFKKLKKRAESDWDFYRVIESSIRLRHVIKSKKHYEPLAYKVDKIPAKMADTSSMKVKIMIGKELLSRGVPHEDISKVVGLVQDILNYKYTPVQLTKENIIPHKYVEPISDTIDRFGGLIMPHYEDNPEHSYDKHVSLEQVSVKNLIHNAQIFKQKAADDEAKAFEEFNSWKKKFGLPLSKPGDKDVIQSEKIKWWKSLAIVGNCEIFQMGA